jgi:hypothetical protein
MNLGMDSKMLLITPQPTYYWFYKQRTSCMEHNINISIQNLSTLLMPFTTTNTLALITSLENDLASADSKVATMSGRANLIGQSRFINYIATSLSLEPSEELAPTATESVVVESASSAAQAASEALSSLYLADNLYA